MVDLDYQEFLETKRKTFIESGFEISENKLNKELKESYFALNEKNHKDFVSEKNATLTLF